MQSYLNKCTHMRMDIQMLPELLVTSFTKYQTINQYILVQALGVKHYLDNGGRGVWIL